MTSRWAAALALALGGSAHAAGPTGPAITVKQVAPPPTLVGGVKTLQVADFGGTNGAAIAAEIRAELANPERLKTDAAAVANAALDAGTDIAASYVGGLVGGGLQGKLVEGLTKNTVTAVRDAVEQEPLLLDDGLAVNPFTVAADGADAVLGGSVDIADTVESYTTKQQAVDSDGQPMVDGEGKPVMVDVSCQRRSVEATVLWTIRGGANAKGEIKRTGGDSRCGSDVGNLLDGQTIAQAMLGGVGTEVVRDLAPAWRVRRMNMNKTKVVKEALKFVRDNDWEGARCAFGTVADANPDDSDAIFDHGVLLEAFGHFDAARARYDQAMAVKAKKPYEKAQERLAERRAEVEAMTSTYGMTWKVPTDPAPCGD